jgi:hypothetical protein
VRTATTAVLASSLLVGACGQQESLATGGREPANEADGRPAAAATAYDGTDAEGATGTTRREVVVSGGTTLTIVLDTPVASDTSRVAQPVQAHLSRAVTVDGVTALEEGSLVTGAVIEAVRAGKVKGRAHVAVRFDSLIPSRGEERYAIRTTSVARTASSTVKEDALTIAVPAAGGAIVGGIIGGKKGAAIGAAAGGGGGTAVVLATRGDEVSLAPDASLSIRLTEPLRVRVAE